MKQDPKIKKEIEKQLSRGLTVGFADEVGMGCLAGDVYACCLIAKGAMPYHEDVNDSKQVNEFIRECLFHWITNKYKGFIGIAKVEEINKMGIFKARDLAMQRAINALKPDVVYIDGNVKMTELSCPQIPIVKGDAKVFGIAAASIVAKVTRDRYMGSLHNEFKHYDWKNNKGYGTRNHLMAIKEHGICEYHRIKFKGGAKWKWK